MPPQQLERLPAELAPTRALLRYYTLVSLLAGPFFFIPLAALYFRYRTLRYRIDDDGISMRWGALFRKEVSLNYRRIQDIHLSSNVLERWLGLGKIQLQTASASAGAEMTLEGLPDLHALRDFLYARMQGARDDGEAETPAQAPARAAAPHDAATQEELVRTLQAVAAEVRALRLDLAKRSDTGD